MLALASPCDNDDDIDNDADAVVGMREYIDRPVYLAVRNESQSRTGVKVAADVPRLHRCPANDDDDVDEASDNDVDDNTDADVDDNDISDSNVLKASSPCERQHFSLPSFLHHPLRPKGNEIPRSKVLHIICIATRSFE